MKFLCSTDKKQYKINWTYLWYDFIDMNLIVMGFYWYGIMQILVKLIAVSFPDNIKFKLTWIWL